MSGSILKADLLRELGYGVPHDALLAELVGAGLTNPRKAGISEDKREQIATLLAARYMRVCSRGDCRTQAPGASGGRLVTPASDSAHCEVCGGSVARSAVDSMVRAFEARRWSKLCVVGGSASTREELRRLVNGRIALRLVEGDKVHTGDDAHANLAWADLTLIWGATELPHKISTLYKGERVIQFAKRSVQELALAAVRAAR